MYYINRLSELTQLRIFYSFLFIFYIYYGEIEQN